MKRRDKEVIMDEETLERALARITHEILERNQGVKDLALIGIRTGGVYLAERIRDKIEQMERVRIPSGIIDITLYRDDFAIGLPRPLVGKTEIPFSLKEKKVVLVDRGHRELPIQADYVGKKIITTPQEEVTVTFRELEGQDRVVVQEIIPE